MRPCGRSAQLSGLTYTSKCRLPYIYCRRISIHRNAQAYHECRIGVAGGARPPLPPFIVVGVDEAIKRESCRRYVSKLHELCISHSVDVDVEVCEIRLGSVSTVDLIRFPGWLEKRGPLDSCDLDQGQH